MTNFKTPSQEETHFKVMRLLEANPDLAQLELAKELGLSVGSIPLANNQVRLINIALSGATLGQDKPIIHSNLALFVVFMSTSALLSPLHSMQAVLIGLNAAFTTIFIWTSKIYFFVGAYQKRMKILPL